MHNVESRMSRPVHKRPKFKVYKNHKSSCQVLKNYKVPRNSTTTVPEQLSQPVRILAIDYSCMPRTVQAFLEASNSKKHSWITQTPVKKPVCDDFVSEKEQNEENLYCDCKRPYSLGELMFKCEGFCEGWYHPECLKMKPDEVERQKVSTERWYCPNCIVQAQKIVMETSEKLLKKIKCSKNNA
jgi:PHD-finger